MISQAFMRNSLLMWNKKKQEPSMGKLFHWIISPCFKSHASFKPKLLTLC